MHYHCRPIAVILLIIYPFSVTCLKFPYSFVLASGVGALISMMVMKWDIGYPCHQSWRHFNVPEFQNYFQEHLYGQHLVEKIVINALRAHISKETPKKALVMSFHGWTGSGKNYAAKLIANSLYAQDIQSHFVKWFIATRDFPHSSELKQYREILQFEITEQTKMCGQSMFIFDEMDKLEPGIIDIIKPYIDFYDDVNGVDYRRNIFIFLSNAGGSEITRVAFNFWLDGKDREDINMRDIEPLITQGAFNEKGGLQFSDLVKLNLIDVYVPFLPMERIHVKQCITYEMKSRNISIKEELVNKIADQIIYYPPEFELFSTSGCKKVSNKVDLYAFE